MQARLRPTAFTSALVVEDNPVLRAVAAIHLRKLGYQVSLAADGLDGISLAQVTSFDLILMDVQMPVMDGLVCTRQIRHLERFTEKHATIIGVSACAVEADCIDAGMDAFILKPLDLRLLKLIVSREEQFVCNSSINI